MATKKSFTDLEQSRKLAEILPLKSADMWFANGIYLMKTSEEPKDIKGVFPCWSLAALLSALPRIEHLKPFIDLSPELDSDKVAIYYHSEDSPYIVRDNLIDACYEMILKLHELKML